MYQTDGMYKNFTFTGIQTRILVVSLSLVPIENVSDHLDGSSNPLMERLILACTYHSSKDS